MKSKKNKIIISCTGIVLLGIIAGFLLNIFTDESRLNTVENKWLADNQSAVISVDIINDVPVISNDGKGLFFDFINDLKTKHNLTINPVTYSVNDDMDEGSFMIKNKVAKDDILFYEEHFVLVAKNDVHIDGLDDISGGVGILQSNSAIINDYYSMEYKAYDSEADLIKALLEGKDINYMLVPQDYLIEEILSNNLSVVYHCSDLINYYVYDTPKEKDVFSDIIYKYYLEWKEYSLEESVLRNRLDIFVNSLGISTKELADMQSKEYTYGFINSKPYEVLAGGNYGGIVSEYLRRFSNFSSVDFSFRKYDNITDFNKAVDIKKVDVYHSIYAKDKFEDTVNTLNMEFYLASPEGNNTYHTLSSVDETVYVLKGSKLEKYLKKVDGLDIKTYSSEDSLKKLAKDDKLIAIDRLNYDFYLNNILKDYSIKYEEVTDIDYEFNIDGNVPLANLFTRYINYLDDNEIVIDGLYSNKYTVEKGSVLSVIAKYVLLFLLVLGLGFYVFYLSNKRVKVSKKIKKEFKIRYIDQLTSLKNRNYLTENISAWNKNTIYPQATIVIDLNNVQEINDTLGYGSGDTQIKAAANILIKTQLDNTDIMRTSGNEFLVYLVGYQERQIISYIRKLNKEFKSLPYEYGAAIGYSIISNDMKTLEDAINESVEDMRTKKEYALEG